MVEITRSEEHEKEGRTFCVVHFFDAETGEAGNCYMSVSYLEKITKAVASGEIIKIGFDRKRHSQFLYTKKV